MGGHQADQTLDEVSLSETTLALEFLLADPHFSVSERTRSLLRYVTKETLAGRAERIKAYTIAVDVFGRPDNFDPSLDPIVRVEASRLRSALHHYNEQFGADIPVRIQLPRGSYVPVFERSGSLGAREAQSGLDTPLSLAALNTKPRPLINKVMFGIAAVAVLTVLGSAWFLFGLSRPLVGKPMLFVNLTASKAVAPALNAARSQLDRAVIEQEAVRLQYTNEFQPSQPSARLDRSSYALDVSIDDAAPKIAVRWRLSETESRDVVASGEEMAVSMQSAATEKMPLVAILVAGNGGAIQTAELARSPLDSLGYPCVLRAERAVIARDTTALQAARNCLNATLERTDSADAHAALGIVMTFLNRVSRNPADLEEAMFHANRAAFLAPASARAALSQMVTNYHEGRLDVAIAAGRRALSLGQNNPEIVSKVSLIMYLGGRWDEGLRLADEALTQARVAKPVGAILVTVLDAYRKGQYDLAIQRVDDAAKLDPVAIMIRLASLQKLGRVTELVTSYDTARTQFQDFDKILRSVADSKKFEPTLAAKLSESLAEIGEIYGSIKQRNSPAIGEPFQ